MVLSFTLQLVCCGVHEPLSVSLKKPEHSGWLCGCSATAPCSCPSYLKQVPCCPLPSQANATCPEVAQVTADQMWVSQALPQNPGLWATQQPRLLAQTLKKLGWKSRA